MMKNVLISELFGSLQQCLLAHIEAGRQEEAAYLCKRIMKLNRRFASRGLRLVGNLVGEGAQTFRIPNLFHPN